MKTKFTPGPWTAINEPYEDGKPYWNIHAGRGFYDCDDQDNGFHIQGIFSNANASLIAAAPEMYKMLALIVKNAQLSNNLLIESELALKKARGE